MVKHQIDEAVNIASEDPLLARLETEAVAEFEKKFLEMVENLFFEV